VTHSNKQYNLPKFDSHRKCPYCGKPAIAGRVTCGGVGDGIDCLMLYSNDQKVLMAARQDETDDSHGNPQK